MAEIDKTNFIVFSFFVILNMTYACVPQSDIALGEKIHYANHVVVGTVTEIIKPDPKYGAGQENAYGAKFMVKCIYKGGSISEDITIVGAGSVADMCHSTNISAGNTYILFLKHENQNEKWFEPMYSENDGSDTFIDEITFNCYMHPIAPIEKGESAKTECPESEDVPGEFCDVWEPPTTVEPVTQPETTTEPEKPDKGGQSPNDGAEKNLFPFLLTSFCVILTVLFL